MQELSQLLNSERFHQPLAVTFGKKQMSKCKKCLFTVECDVFCLFVNADLSRVVSNTVAIAEVTHADPRCKASCVAVTVAVSLRY